jgi:hypothetical protein
LGQNINGDPEGQFGEDVFGQSVTITPDGSTLAVGAPFSSSNAPNGGYVRVYKNQNSNWVQIGQDINGEDFNLLGWSVDLSLDGETVVIGGTGDNSNVSIGGVVRIFQNELDNWVQVGEDIEGVGVDDQFGMNVAVSADGNIIAVATPRTDFNGSQSGSVDLFYNQNANWIQLGNPITGSFALNFLGNAMALSADGRVLAAGGDGSGTTQDQPGSVLIFDIPPPPLSITGFETFDFEIYPNPTNDNVTIQLDKLSDLETIRIYDSLGQLALSSRESTINIEGLASGLYTVEIETTRGRGIKKLIVE